MCQSGYATGQAAGNENIGDRERRLFACAHSAEAGPGSVCRALSKSAMCRAATTVHTFGRMLASGLRYLIGCVPRRAARLSHGPSLAPWVPAAVPCLAALCPDHVAAAHAGP